MLAVVVLFSEQFKNVNRVMSALLKQSADFDKCLAVVAPGPEADKTAQVVKNYGFQAIVADHGVTGFNAGANRDAGIDHILTNYGKCDFVFLDGDCIPSPGLVAHHKSVLSLKFPIMTAGARRNLSEPVNGVSTRSEDLRMVHPMLSRSVFCEIDRVIAHSKPIRAHGTVWSCNLGMNHSMVQALRTTQCLNRCFHPVFDTKYGGEDTLAGLVAFISGAVVTLTPERSWVEHIWHPTDHQKDHRARAVIPQFNEILSSLPHTDSVTLNAESVFDSRQFYENLVEVTSGGHSKCVAELTGSDPVLTTCICAQVLETKIRPGKLLGARPDEVRTVFQHLSHFKIPVQEYVAWQTSKEA